MENKRSSTELWQIAKKGFLKDRVWKCVYCPWYNNTQTHPYKCENCLRLCKIQKFTTLVKVKLLAIEKEKKILANNKLNHFDKVIKLKELTKETKHDTSLSCEWEEYHQKIKKNPRDIFHLLSPTKTGKSRDNAKSINWFP